MGGGGSEGQGRKGGRGRGGKAGGQGWEGEKDKGGEGREEGEEARRRRSNTGREDYSWTATATDLGTLLSLCLKSFFAVMMSYKHKESCSLLRVYGCMLIAF